MQNTNINNLEINEITQYLKMGSQLILPQGTKIQPQGTKIQPPPQTMEIATFLIVQSLAQESF